MNIVEYIEIPIIITISAVLKKLEYIFVKYILFVDFILYVTHFKIKNNIYISF